MIETNGKKPKSAMIETNEKKPKSAMIETNRNKSKYIRPSTVILILFVAGAAILAFRIWSKEQKREAALVRVQALCDKYEVVIPEALPGMIDLESLGLSGKVAVTASTKTERIDYTYGSDYDGPPVYKVDLNYSVELKEDGYFEQYGDRGKYDLLRDFHYAVNEAYCDLLWHLPEYMDRPTDRDKDGVSFWYDGDESFIIRTAGHSYEYASNVEDYYLYDGDDHFLRDKESRWYIEPDYSNYGGGSSSGSYGRYDPYGADDYDDPDSYAEEHIEDFLDDGYDYDEAYEEAYDHWEDWNE